MFTAASLAPTSVANPAAPVLTPAVFLALSSGLTGVSPASLKPAFDPLDIAGLFYATLRARVPAPVLDHMAGTFLAASTPAEGAAAVLDDSNLGPVGHSVLKLWLLGVWHDTSVPAVAIDILPSYVYKQSLIWRAMQFPKINARRG